MKGYYRLQLGWTLEIVYSQIHKESRIEDTRQLVFNGTVSVWDESLEMDGCHSTVHLKMVNFMLSMFYHNKKEH